MERVKNGALVFCLFIVLLVIFSSYFRATAVGSFFGALAGTPLLVHVFNRIAPGRPRSVSENAIAQLVTRGADVRALIRDPAKAKLPAGVNVVQGDLLDVDSLRNAFAGASTLFLLNSKLLLHNGTKSIAHQLLLLRCPVMLIGHK